MKKKLSNIHYFRVLTANHVVFMSTEFIESNKGNAP